MSIEFISGKPGGGKSFFATTLVVEELRRTKRFVVTNLALDIPGLCQYLHDTFGDTFEASRRIHTLTEQETAQFWLVYGPGLVLDSQRRVQIPLPNGKTIKHLDFSPRHGSSGVLYVIDEIHEFFNARRWADTGEDALHYLSQHRKLGDDVIAITQSIAHVDKQFQRVAQSFTYVRNFSKEKLAMLGGIFRSVPLFMRSTYLEPATGQGAKPMETRTFRLDVKGIGSCYKTAAGVGVVGTSADSQAKTRGLSPLWLVPLAVGIMLFLHQAPDVLGKKVGGSDYAHQMMTGQFRGGSNAPAGSPGSGVTMRNLTVPDPSGGSLPPPVTMRNSDPSKAVEPPIPDEWDGVRLTGYALFPGGKFAAYFSNGRTLRPGDPELEFVGPDYVRVKGRNIYRSLPQTDAKKEQKLQNPVDRYAPAR